MKTKVLISFAVTAKLICVFVFANAKNQFSHDDQAQLSQIGKSVAYCMCTPYDEEIRDL